MLKTLEKTLTTRKVLYKFLTETSDEQLALIPEGFNNNIFWNIAHVVVTQQLLVYKFSGLPLGVSDVMVDKYRKGSKPDGSFDIAEKELIKDLLLSSIEKTITDYKSGLFTKYSEYMTSIKVALLDADDAITFNLYHEGIHLGSVLALRRVIAKDQKS